MRGPALRGAIETPFFYHWVKACGQIQRKTWPERADSTKNPFLSRLVRLIPARGRARRYWHAWSRRTRSLPPQLRKVQETSFVYTSNTQSHTHAHTHAVTKGDQASFSAGKAFCKVSALVPTLGLLLVFSISCRGIKGPGGQQLLFIIGKASVARMSVKNDKNARNPRGTRGFRPFSSFCPKSYLVFCFAPMCMLCMLCMCVLCVVHVVCCVCCVWCV